MFRRSIGVLRIPLGLVLRRDGAHIDETTSKNGRAFRIGDGVAGICRRSALWIGGKLFFIFFTSKSRLIHPLSLVRGPPESARYLELERLRSNIDSKSSARDLFVY